MGYTVHRVISVVGLANGTMYEAHVAARTCAADAIKQQSDSEPPIVSQLHDLINSQQTFTVHSNGSNHGYADQTTCTEAMDNFVRFLASKSDRLQWVDVSYSKDRFLDALGQQPFAVIESATYRTSDE